MTFLAPASLLLSLLAVPIVLMYILKLRRQERRMASTLLWQRALDDVQANAPWQRLRKSLLLLLQLLALGALVLTMAQPAFTRSRAFAGDLILIVDQSYGMQAHDVAPSRFQVALQQAHALAGSVGNGNVVSVIGMGAEPRLAIAESDDAGAVSRAIDSLRVGVAPPNLLGAVSLASSLGRSGVPTRAVILTSRDSGIARLPLSVPFPVEIVRVGGVLHDLGITAFSASADGRRTVAIARISNFGVTSAGSDVELTADGQLVDVRPVSVDAGQQQDLVWTQLPATAGKKLELRITRRDDVSDDKAAWSVLNAGTQRRVLLVTDGDLFLQTALQDDPSVDLSTVRTAAYRPALTRGFDLVIFDGYLPARLPSASTLLVGPPEGRVDFLRVGPYLGGSPRGTPLGSLDKGPSSALAVYLDLSDVHVARARQLGLPSWMAPAISSAGAPILAAGANGNQRIAVLGFRLQESDWPLRISFPILVHNLLAYLSPGMTLGAANRTAGQSVQLFPPAGTKQIDITRPDGGVDHLTAPFPPYTNTSAPGLYTARAVDAGTGNRPVEATFAVNFFPARPAPATGPSSVLLGHQTAGKARAVGVPVSLAWAVGLVALALLATEWFVAFKR